MLEQVSERAGDFVSTRSDRSEVSFDSFGARVWKLAKPPRTQSLPESPTDVQIKDASGLRLAMVGGTPASAAPCGTTFTILKRLFDVTASLGLIVVFAPLMIFIAIVIKRTSAGPVLFIQDREGLGRRNFKIYKFRTMFTDVQDVSGVQHTVRGDKRVTSVGRFLRAASLDEIPQLFNILRGQMSFVGPRPHVPGMRVAGELYDRAVPHYAYRYQVKPGLTGWAQANGLRGPAVATGEATARIDHDAAYIQNRSVWLEARILLRTFVQEFVTGSGV